jgi:hypothetical protein
MQLDYEGYINGAFKGWQQNSVYELTNRQRFKLRHYKYEYRYMFRPRAKLWRDGARYFLEVECMRDAVEVVPVR